MVKKNHFITIFGIGLLRITNQLMQSRFTSSWTMKEPITVFICISDYSSLIFNRFLLEITVVTLALQKLKSIVTDDFDTNA